MHARQAQQTQLKINWSNQLSQTSLAFVHDACKFQREASLEEIQYFLSKPWWSRQIDLSL